MELGNICALFQLRHQGIWNIFYRSWLEQRRMERRQMRVTPWRYPIYSIQYAIDWTWNTAEKDEEWKTQNFQLKKWGRVAPLIAMWKNEELTGFSCFIVLIVKASPLNRITKNREVNSAFLFCFSMSEMVPGDQPRWGRRPPSRLHLWRHGPEGEAGRGKPECLANGLEFRSTGKTVNGDMFCLFGNWLKNWDRAELSRS